MMPARSRFRRTIAAALGCLLLVTTTAGCYEYAPLPARPIGTPTRVDVLLNERGRADFVNRLGPDVLSLEGTLVSRTDSAMTVRVAEVTYINRSTTQWSGEELVIGENQVRDIRSKRLSGTRTGLVAGITAGAALLFIITRSITSGGGNDNSPNVPPPTNSQ